MVGSAVQHLNWDPFTPLDDPYPVYRAIRDDHPVFHNAERDVWALSRFADVQAAARDWDAFRNAPEGVDLDATGAEIWGPGNFLDLDPPRHKELRDLVRRRFTPRAINDLEAYVQTRASRLIEQFAGRGHADVVGEFSFPLTLGAGPGRLLGFQDDELETLGSWFRVAMRREPGRVEIPRDAVEAGERIRSYLLDAIDDRRRSPGPDLISDIVGTDGSQELGEEALGLCFILFAASIDTASSLISTSLALLEEHPDQRALLIREPERFPAAVEELVRYEAPVQFNARRADRDVELHGVTIPAGARVVLLFGAANRDERRFDAPDELDITREAKRHLSFGEGIHFCLGAPLARLEACVGLATFLERIPNYAAAAREPLTKQNLRGFSSLEVEFG